MVQRIRGSFESLGSRILMQLLDPTDHGNLKRIRITDPFRGSKRIQTLFFHRSSPFLILQIFVSFSRTCKFFVLLYTFSLFFPELFQNFFKILKNFFKVDAQFLENYPKVPSNFPKKQTIQIRTDLLILTHQ